MQSPRGQKAIIYVRQSTKKEETISPEVQVEHCMSACARSGYEIAGEPVVDLNLSGRNFKNRSIAPIIERVKNGEAQVVVTWKWSRWGRNLTESLLCLAELAEAGGRLESATEPMDASTSAGRFSRTTMLAIAEFQSDQIGETWKDARRYMLFKRALPPTAGGRLGYIYDKATTSYSVDPLSGPALKAAYQKYISGHSFWALALQMRNQGVVSTNGNPIAEPGLRHAMDTGFAAGKIYLAHPEKILTPDEMDAMGAEVGKPLHVSNMKAGSPSWEPLIDEDTWNRYRIQRKIKKDVPPRARNATMPLSRLLRCAGCNRNMIYRADRERWSCSTSNIKLATSTCTHGVIIKDCVASDAVKGWLREHSDEAGEPAQGALIRQRALAAQTKANISGLESQLRREERRRGNLLDMAADGTLTRDDIKGKMRSITAEIDRIADALAQARKEHAVAVMPLPSSFGALLNGWGKMSPSVMNQGLSTVIHAIYVYPQRDMQRTIVVGKWEVGKEVPEVSAPDAGDENGRVCTGCREYKTAENFSVVRKTGKLESRCHGCRADAAQHRRASQAASSSR